jgi:hypothetical protein
MVVYPLWGVKIVAVTITITDLVTHSISHPDDNKGDTHYTEQSDFLFDCLLDFDSNDAPVGYMSAIWRGIILMCLHLEQCTLTHTFDNTIQPLV